MSISKKLVELRKKRELTISKCAKEIGVSASTYRDWEYGRSISGEPYLAIAKLFGISLAELFSIDNSQVDKNLKEIESDLKKILNHIKNTRSYL